MAQNKIAQKPVRLWESSKMESFYNLLLLTNHYETIEKSNTCIRIKNNYNLGVDFSYTIFAISPFRWSFCKNLRWKIKASANQAFGRAICMNFNEQKTYETLTSGQLWGQFLMHFSLSKIHSESSIQICNLPNLEFSQLLKGNFR